MFNALKNRFKDVKTLSSLCTVAEEIARGSGRSAPGSEHFILSALRLGDGSAQAVFERLGISANAFEQSITAQFAQALETVGIAVSPEALPGGSGRQPARPEQPASVLYQAEVSGQALMQRLADSKSSRPDRPLLGVDVLLSAAFEEHTIAARAFRHLGISRARLTRVATEVAEAKKINA